MLPVSVLLPVHLYPAEPVRVPELASQHILQQTVQQLSVHACLRIPCLVIVLEADILAFFRLVRVEVEELRRLFLFFIHTVLYDIGEGGRF